MGPRCPFCQNSRCILGNLLMVKIWELIQLKNKKLVLQAKNKHFHLRERANTPLASLQFLELCFAGNKIRFHICWLTVLRQNVMGWRGANIPERSRPCWPGL